MTMTRTECDSLGAIEIPVERLWGAQTQPSLEHFHISSEHMPQELILALAAAKHACALVNRDLGLLNPDKAAAIVQAAEEVLAGHHAEWRKMETEPDILFNDSVHVHHHNHFPLKPRPHCFDIPSSPSIFSVAQEFRVEPIVVNLALIQKPPR